MAQRAHWDATYAAHPGMYGHRPSEPAAEVFRAAGAREVLELGAGHGRDSLFFARRLVDCLAEGRRPDDVHAFEEGELPRRLRRVTQTVPMDVR
ncbi:hypothetical protein ACFV9E_29755 [Streptomyces sp. NPDC059835]|uniref:hypothetical protein n=1 Tax=Streptomyces sp. NPDC059835 TaxID=3346967 RepID=UPI0036552F04